MDIHLLEPLNKIFTPKYMIMYCQITKKNIFFKKLLKRELSVSFNIPENPLISYNSPENITNNEKEKTP
ncbi:hypothetical protein BsIDN1_32910 [Bacillus safensis]|uniref:Uncharacterized protein n=1 Tax=Bacillus safensis TaxID=561879 RepID=A0A5S9M959_BACIA|nr:hypothetical protein BsIDN1_32910 [Bacillus safensis]